MKNTFPIKHYMTTSPHTIGEDIPLSKAIEMMREHKIRHLPVQYRAKLSGILSDRDVHLALSVYPAAHALKVGDIMTETPYRVREDCPLNEVVAEMAKHKYGSAVIEDENGRAVGIFTAVDAMGLLAEWMRKKFLSGEELDSRR